ncbi:hypothetical protein A2U01_0083673, partial [Trifolium medium]|nr:hypothetical protein [Trifolium medium]
VMKRVALFWTQCRQSTWWEDVHAMTMEGGRWTTMEGLKEVDGSVNGALL